MHGKSNLNLNQGSSSDDKLPRINWPHHAAAFQNASSKDHFLSSNFLFSLPKQRPIPETSSEGMLALRSTACKIQGPERLQVAWIEKAWHALCNTQVACKSYLRPGLSAPVQNQTGDHIPTWDTGSNVKNISNAQRTGSPSHRRGNNTREHTSSHLPVGSNSCAMAYASNQMVQPNTINNSKPCPSSSIDVELHRVVLVDDNLSANDNFVDAMDDDEILENIDVDQIVTEHYQATSTPQGSAPKQISFTPCGNRSKSAGPDEDSLPSELCEICYHGCKLVLCPEATIHLQEMKDQLIAVSNELLDNVAELSPQHSENLRQKRLHLNKQIQQLGKYMNSLTQDEERQQSHLMASTTATTQGLRTPISTLAIDAGRFNSQVYIRNEPGNSGICYSPAPFSYMDGLGTPSAPMQREFTPKLINVSYTEGSNDKRWSSMDFPWTKELEINNREVFGNHSFRPNQREIINATMSRHDVFVLMPTGGGKSLTYQLPALIHPGITLVVSPLVSLIQDQIMHLLQANIPATYLSASMEWAEQQEIFRELMYGTCKYKLLYVTPEKIAKSDVLLRHLDNLYSRECLSRIVIDEAHCVSQWGHDFRPDYQGLGILKQKFPKTPVLALTATATASVKEDVVQALGLTDCIVFRQSFNRPNLSYSVMPKTKKCLEDIDNFIKKNHRDECGIIYCLSRMDCEKVADKLQACGHKAAFYHGSMDPIQRAYVQKEWSRDKINIICATVAFGMGINKPDVRFVIHHSLPKSIEGYHQECGRAGRDGQPSSCVLYYNYADYIRVKHMITQGVVEQSSIASGSRNISSSCNERVLETNTENLLRMVGYCENNVDCRRLLQLIHFGEKFNPANCRKTCDNCSKMLRWVEKDVTNIARQLVELVLSTRQACSTSHILEIFRGSMSQNVKKHRHDALKLHGAGKHLDKGEAARILRHLVTEDILVEDVKKSDIYGSVSSVLKVNQTKGQRLLSGEQNIVLRFPFPEKTPKVGKLDETPAKASLAEIDKSVQAQNGADPVLSEKLRFALKSLRDQLLKESGDGLSAFHIFTNITLRNISEQIPRTKEELLEIHGIGRAKVSRYGDLVLATIEDVLAEHQKTNRNSSSGSNENMEAVKRRRGFTTVNTDGDDDDFEQSAVQSKKRVVKTGSIKQRTSDSVDEGCCIDVDLDGYELLDDELSPNQKPVASGRVLPQWSTTKTKGNIPISKLFEEYAYTK